MIFLIHGVQVADHDVNAEGIMSKMVKVKMTLNITKCVFRKQKVEFLGYQIANEGIRPVNEKLEAIISEA